MGVWGWTSLNRKQLSKFFCMQPWRVSFDFKDVPVLSRDRTIWPWGVPSKINWKTLTKFYKPRKNPHMLMKLELFSILKEVAHGRIRDLKRGEDQNIKRKCVTAGPIVNTEASQSPLQNLPLHWGHNEYDKKGSCLFLPWTLENYLSQYSISMTFSKANIIEEMCIS